MKLRAGYVTLLAVLMLGAVGVAKEKVVKEKSAKKVAKSKSLIAPGAEARKLAGDFKFTDGPAGDAVGDV